MTFPRLDRSLTARLGLVRGVLLDVDGCLALFDGATADSGAALPGAAALVAGIHAAGLPLIAFTNASGKTPRRIAAALRGLGVDVGPDEVLTPPVVAVEVIRERYQDRPVLAFGGPGLHDVLVEGGVRLAGLDDNRPVRAVVVGWDSDFTPARLQVAAEALWDGAELLVTSDARSFASRGRPTAGVSGFIAHGLAHVGGRGYEVLGKPSPIAMRVAARRLGLDPARLLVVGDDLSLEIRMARAAGALSVLVTTGTHGADDIAALPASARPDLVVPGLHELLQLWRSATERSDDGYSV